MTRVTESRRAVYRSVCACVSVAASPAAAIAAVAGAVLVAIVAPAAASTAAQTPMSYPSCGFYWNRNTPLSPAERRANACIVRASREGSRARLVSALTTVEGDPVVAYVFVRSRRDILVVVDATRDLFSSRRWERLRCTSLAVHSGYLFWHGCTPAGLGKPSWLKPVRLPR